MNNDSCSIVIRGLGSYKPAKTLTNNDLAKIVDTSDEWIRTRTGIHSRHIAESSETASSMGAEAAKKAIKNAGIKTEDIDIIIVGSITPDMIFPSTACLIQEKLKLKGVPSFDLQAACSGFLYALETAKHFLSSGNYRNALIIGTEKLSSITDWEDRATCVLFGDGAGAAVLSRISERGYGVLDSILGADGGNAGLLKLPGGGSALPTSEQTIRDGQHFIKMNGPELFKVAVRMMELSCMRILERNKLLPSDIAYIIPHQANLRIIETLSNRLKFPMDRVILNLQELGNTSAASIPLALDEAVKDGKIQRGDNIMFVAFGAGLTWGSTLLKWY